MHRPVLSLITVVAVFVASACLASDIGEPISEFESTPYPTGLTFDGTYLWLSDRDCGWIYALDPTDGSFVDSVVCPSFSPLGLAFGDRSLWVSGYYEDQIYKIDLDSRKVVDVIGAPSSRTAGLAWQDGYLWACDTEARQIVKLDPDDGTPIRSFKSPSRYSHGLAFDGRYLWVSDRREDEIYMVDPATGWVIATFDSPGPYPRGLAWDGENLWNADYQNDAVYSLVIGQGETQSLHSPKRSRIRFTFKIRCKGPDPVEKLDMYLAIPHDDLQHQKLLSEVTFQAEPSDFVNDKWGQEFAHFVITDIPPGETKRVWYETSAEISAQNRFLIPENTGTLHQIPRDLKARYTVDGSRLLIDDPLIRSAIDEAVGNERNPYWIVRKIFEYINERIEYELVGGWDTAPNVLKRGTGSCSEYSFVFMAMARGAGIPTRFCAGVSRRGDDASMDDVFHRWTEVYLPNYGWVPIDASGGDREWQADCAKAIGSYPSRMLITTVGGGDSEYLGWSYNYGYSYTYTGRTSIDAAAYADWEPLE